MPLENGAIVPVSKQIKMADISKEAEIATAPEAEATAGKSEGDVPKAIKSEPANLDNDSKKRKRHEGETPEERAERKRKKKEKKEKRKSKQDGSGDSD